MCFLEDMEGGEEEEEIRRPEQTKEEEGGVKPDEAMVGEPHGRCRLLA